MSSRRDPEPPAQPKTGFSRRGFIRGVGLGSGAMGTGLLERAAVAAPAPANVAGPGPVPITLTINGKPVNVTVEPRVTLLDAMRNYLGLTGAKRVCDRGTCGACTVILAGKTVYSCSVLAIDAQGKNIETIEGLAAGNNLHPVSAAFVNNDAQQCGYCTAGFVMAAKGSDSYETTVQGVPATGAEVLFSLGAALLLTLSSAISLAISPFVFP